MLDIFILIFLRPFASPEIQQRSLTGTLQRKSSSSLSCGKARKDKVLRKPCGLRLDQCQLQDWPGGTTDHQYPVHVTCNVSLSQDHFISTKPTQERLKMTLGWVTHSLFRSPPRNSDEPINIFLLLTRSAAYVMMWFTVTLFNPSCVKIFNWKICFLTIVATQLSNPSCPGNTTAMNALLGREESIGVPVNDFTCCTERPREKEEGGKRARMTLNTRYE